MFNKSVLVGRISNDLELRQTNNGKSYCKFNLAVNRMNDGTDFITITVWNKQAENIVEYQSKGSLILVEGSISTGSYTDSDGNSRKTFEVIANNVQFLSSKKKENGETEQSNMEYNDSDPYAEFGETVTIDDDFLE